MKTTRRFVRSRGFVRVLHPSVALLVLATVLAAVATVAPAALKQAPAAAELPTGSTNTTIAPGAYIIDMGVPVQTIANGLKPYGLVYDLIVNKQVPVSWAISGSKARDGVDFTAGGVNYSGGSFVIAPEYAAAAAASIATYRALGVKVDGPIATSFTIPEYSNLTSWPRIVLDKDNGSIAADYYTNAGIPTTAYRIDLPAGLTACDDLYVMPHADPAVATHSNLRAFNNNGGYIWAACHSVSVLENLDDPATTQTKDFNFLSNSGLVPFGAHADGSPPYTYNGAPSDPVMQFIGPLDGAMLNGSEQIYLPAIGSGWRPTTRVLVSDTTQANVPGLSPGRRL